MNTYTDTYTHTRIEILGFHFELFLRAAGMSESEIDKFLDSVQNQELEAVGIFVEDEQYTLAEVELAVDWSLHKEMVKTHGEQFSDDIGGWKEGVSPEAYVAVQRLVKYAKQNKRNIRSWIRVSSSVRSSPEKHKKVCEKLGYNYYSSHRSKWKGEPISTELPINNLAEAKIIRRFSS